MKKAFNFIFTFWPSIILSAQIEPVQNPAEELQALKVKSIHSYVHISNDSSEKKDHLILKATYDNEGNLLEKYQLFLWEAVSYSYTTAYSYNEKGLLTEEEKIQEILNLSQRDEDYIRIFRTKPLNQKIIYQYNEKYQLIKKEVFVFDTKLLDEAATPDQVIIYQYDRDLMISQESSSAEDRLFDRNFTIRYQYDSLNNLTSEIRHNGKDQKLVRSTYYTYDSKNRMIEKKIVDTFAPHNNAHFRFEYNEDGKLQEKYVFEEEINEFELETSYQYDAKGNAVSGDREVRFEYYDNGLIRSESWTDPVTDQSIEFTTSYDFF